MSKKADLRQQQLAESFVKEHISRCPICKTAHVEWTFEHASFMQDKNVHYQCGHCGCMLSTAYGDMKGVRGNGFSEFMRGAASYDAMVRSVYGKK